MKGSQCSQPKNKGNPAGVRGLGAMRAETGSEAGDQLPVAFFGCHSTLGTKLRQKVGAQRRVVLFLSPSHFLLPGGSHTVRANQGPEKMA